MQALWADFAGEDYRCGFLGGCCVMGRAVLGRSHALLLLCTWLQLRAEPSAGQEQKELQPGERAHLFPRLRMSSALHFGELWQETQ